MGFTKVTHALFHLTLENAEKGAAILDLVSTDNTNEWSNLENSSNSTLDILDNPSGFRNGQLRRTTSHWWITQVERDTT